MASKFIGGQIKELGGQIKELGGQIKELGGQIKKHLTTLKGISILKNIRLIITTEGLLSIGELRILNKNNLLIQSNYSLNETQNKYYLSILYNMQKDSNGDYSCSLPLDHFKELTKNKTHKNVNGVKDVLHNLMGKRIELRKLKPDKKDHVYFTRNIINGFDFDTNTNLFRIILDSTIYDLLIEYYKQNQGYTPLNLAILLGLNNYYAQRLYELLRMESWKKKSINITLVELKEALELTNKYKEYKDFKKRVLLPSINALNQTGRMKIDFKENKVTRKVYSIDFIVEDLEPREYFINDSEVKTISEPIQDILNVEECKTTEITTEKLTEANKSIKSSDNIDASDLDLEFWSKGAQILVKKFIKNYDSEFIEEAYLYASTLMIDKDNVDVLSHKQLNLFKKIFSEYIEKAEKDKLDEFFSDVENNMFW